MLSFTKDELEIMMKENLEFRFAKETDAKLILNFIKGLAEYENMLDEVAATEELLQEWIFEKKKAEVIFAMVEGKEIGFALFFHNFSTFIGKAGIYLEDLKVCAQLEMILLLLFSVATMLVCTTKNEALIRFVSF